MDRIKKILSNRLFLDINNEITELERDRIFCKHGIEHLTSVARIMYINNLENGLGLDKELIYASALLHDIGRAEQYKNGREHSIAGLEISKKILSMCGFSEDEIELINSAIGSHNSNEECNNELSNLLKYADKKSRNCFLCLASAECYWSDEKKNKTIEY
ncbi:HD domain-containing protein [Peptostreptococcus porci]|uniref:HD domain-containing protein n=1 Tax=Peptostreptococcus porci TaxID=2652282 RepID=UPI002A919AC8|nr:HD domain-containing protein [Peptostreptococcus porci]MDY5435563.1 HD domain-containing protein [Peptostreptococcus porci]MDY6231525.1 HD domain-containing protein [Peptostreptococcus porci]